MTSAPATGDVRPPQELRFGQVWPDLETFRVLARDHRVVPVVRTLLADTDTPVGLFARLGAGRPGSFLLESAERDGTWGRWSFVGVRSSATLTCAGSPPVARWVGSPPAGIPGTGTPLEVLRAALSQLRTAAVPGLPPLTGGLVGVLGWDMAGQWESLPRAAASDVGLPELSLCLATDLAVVDHRAATLWLIANAVNHDGSDARVDEAWADAVARLDRMTDDVAGSGPPLPPLVDQPDDSGAAAGGIDEPEVRSGVSRQRYLDMVESAKQAIRDGEAFQIVVSQRFSVDAGDITPLGLYRSLRATNPSPYMYLLHLTDADGRPFHVVGSSPEALVTVAEGSVTSRPIAGTRPRSGDVAVDAQRARDLLADPKELAEHLMLVDLARNDLSRVCRAGTVTVEEYMQVQPFSHVLHIASTVRGRVREDVDAVDVLAATFPAGTLSGAPKVRAIELIDDLEPTRRGVYGGAVGYFDFAGNADLAIAIRTGVMVDGVLHVQAGAGIVADSVAATEHEECRSKAAAVLRAASRARRLRPVAGRRLTGDPVTGGGTAPGTMQP